MGKDNIQEGTTSAEKTEQPRSLYIQRSHVSPFSPTYLDLENNPKAISTLLPPNQFVFVTDTPVDITGNPENYGLSPFQLQKHKEAYPGLPLYSYRITLEIPPALQSKLTLVAPNDLSSRIDGTNIQPGEFNGVFLPEEIYDGINVTIYVAEISSNGELKTNYSHQNLKYFQGLTIDVIEDNNDR